MALAPIAVAFSTSRSKAWRRASSRSRVYSWISPPTMVRSPAMMLPPSPRLRTTTPKHCPSVWTVRCPAMFSVVTTIMREFLPEQSARFPRVSNAKPNQRLHHGGAERLQSLFADRRRAGRARDLVLRAHAAGTADRADQFAVLDQRNAAARAHDVVDRQDIFIIIFLNCLFEGFRRATEFGRGARLVLGDGDRAELGAVHAPQGDEIGPGIDDGHVKRPAVLLGLGSGRGDRGLSAAKRNRRPLRNVQRHLVGDDVERIGLLRARRARNAETSRQNSRAQPERHGRSSRKPRKGILRCSSPLGKNPGGAP